MHTENAFFKMLSRVLLFTFVIGSLGMVTIICNAVAVSTMIVLTVTPSKRRYVYGNTSQ